MDDPILTPSYTDKTVALFDQIFGANWWLIITNQANMGDTATVFWSIMSGFVAVVMAGMGVLIAYLALVGAMGSAHEGKFLGEKYHSVWVPARLGIGVALIAPIPVANGVTLIHAIILSLLYMSVGGANWISNEAVDYLADNRGQLTTVYEYDKIYDIAQNSLVSMTVQLYEVQLRGAELPNLVSDKFIDGAWHLTFDVPKNQGLEPGDLGKIILPCKDGDRNSTMCTYRRSAIREMLQALVPAAQKATLDLRLRNDAYIDPAIGSRAVQAYVTTEKKGIQALTLEGGVEYDRKMTETIKGIKDEGVFGLGKYYKTIADMQSQITHEIGERPYFVKPDWNNVSAHSYPSEIAGFVNWATKWGNKYIKSDDDVARGIHKESGAMGIFMEHVATPFVALKYVDYVGSHADPIGALQQFGNAMIITGEAVMVGIVGMNSIAGAAKEGNQNAWSKAAGLLPGVGILKDGAVGGLVGAIGALTTIAYILTIPLILSGMALALYLPLVPFIKWTMAMIHFTLTVMISMVGAVIWVAGITLPEGEGALGNRGSQGLMLLMNTLFTLPLLTFGFWLSIQLISLLGYWVSQEMVSSFIANQSGSLSGIITMIGLILITTGIFIAITDLIFSLPMMMSDRVLSWIGQQRENLTAETDQEAGKARGTFVAGVGGMNAPAATTQRAFSPTGGKVRPPGSGPGGTGNNGGKTTISPSAQDNDQFDRETPRDPKSVKEDY